MRECRWPDCGAPLNESDLYDCNCDIPECKVQACRYCGGRQDIGLEKMKEEIKGLKEGA